MAALPTWIRDLFPGVSEKQLRENILSYGGTDFPVNLEFILLDPNTHQVQLESQSSSETLSAPAAPKPIEAAFLCTDVLNDSERTIRYTIFHNIEDYEASLAALNPAEIATRSLVKIKPGPGKSPEEIMKFFTEWGVFDKKSADAIQSQNMEENFEKISSSVVKTAIAAGTGDGIWMGLCVALYNKIGGSNAVEISTAVIFPFVIAPIAAYISYELELKNFEKENQRKANPAERRAFRKRAIDLGWQVLAGMVFWTAGYYLAIYVLPILFSALGWATTGPIGHLVIASFVGLCQAIGTTIVDAMQQQREYGKIDYVRLAAVFATEFVTGFAWYSMSIIIPMALAEPLGHLLIPAYTAVCVVVSAAAAFVVNTFFNAVIPWAGNAYKSMNILASLNKAVISVASSVASAASSLRATPTSAPPAASKGVPPSAPA